MILINNPGTNISSESNDVVYNQKELPLLLGEGSTDIGRISYS